MAVKMNRSLNQSAPYILNKNNKVFLVQPT